MARGFGDVKNQPQTMYSKPATRHLVAGPFVLLRYRWLPARITMAFICPSLDSSLLSLNALGKLPRATSTGSWRPPPKTRDMILRHYGQRPEGEARYLQRVSEPSCRPAYLNFPVKIVKQHNTVLGQGTKGLHTGTHSARNRLPNLQHKNPQPNVQFELSVMPINAQHETGDSSFT